MHFLLKRILYFFSFKDAEKISLTTKPNALYRSINSFDHLFGGRFAEGQIVRGPICRGPTFLGGQFAKGQFGKGPIRPAPKFCHEKESKISYSKKMLKS